MTKTSIRTIIWITAYAIAMGFLESAVVVYLRELYYPGGFHFPLQTMEQDIVKVEFLREAATIIMLLSAGVLAGKKITDRFAFFIYSFAVWDIFYYIFLKLLVNWPDSLMTRDILFLIPVTWVGPVISPVIISFTMILLALLIVYFSEKTDKVRISTTEWLMLIIGSVILIVGFTEDYCSFLLQHYSLSELFTGDNYEKIHDLSLSYVPGSFSWIIFMIAETVIISGIAVFFFRNRSNTYCHT